MSASPATAETEAARRFSLRHVQPGEMPRSYGDALADTIAATVGSWRFIVAQSVILAFWIVFNVVAWVHHWDPYPFILLNLVLSFQAAFTAPVLMMAQNRQAMIDRQKAQLDYDVNLRAELDIESLHEKIDLLRQQDITRLIGLLEMLTKERLQKEGEPET